MLAYHDRPARAFRRRLAQANADVGVQEPAGRRLLFGDGGEEEGGPEADNWLIQVRLGWVRIEMGIDLSRPSHLLHTPSQIHRGKK